MTSRKRDIIASSDIIARMTNLNLTNLINYDNYLLKDKFYH